MIRLRVWHRRRRARLLSRLATENVNAAAVIYIQGVKWTVGLFHNGEEVSE